MQSPEDTVAASADDTEATNPVDRPSPERRSSPKRRRPLHARIAPSGPKRRRPVAEIIHPEQQDTAPPPLSQSARRTVSAIIKATEGAAPPPPKGVAAQWPPQHGPPSPLPTFIKFADLKAAGIVNNHCALKILIDDHNFPKGRWLGSATHVWTLNEVEQWLANRPVERPVPSASDKGRR